MRKEINGVTANYIYIDIHRTVRYHCSSLPSDSVECDRAANEYTHATTTYDDVVTDGETEEHSRSRYCNVSYLILLKPSRALRFLFMNLVT